MSLLEDIKEHYKTEKYPPIDELDDAECVSEKALDQRRWGVTTEFVFKRGDEYVAVLDTAPATEYQSWGDYGDPDIYLVEPVEVKKIVYKRLDK